MEQRGPFGVVGWREMVTLSDYSDDLIKAKVDTGAKTSAIHAWNIRPFDKDGADWVEFELHPDQKSNKRIVKCVAPVYKRKAIKSSNGVTEVRFSVLTNVKIGLWSFPAEITLTNRDEMGFRMLLGRSFLRKRFIVDCGRSWLTRPLTS